MKKMSERLKKMVLLINKIQRKLDWKRFFDLFLTFPAVCFLLPFFGIIAWWIKRDSPGPIFFRGARAGKGGHVFQIFKFRTMYDNPESFQGPRITGQDDTRITRAGYWLRETKLNELPQLFNVLKGEMSLVGPRPEDPTLVAKWPMKVQQEILSVRPGITSPASVQFRHEESMLHQDGLMDTYFNVILPTKLRLDTLYVRNYSFLLDLDTLFWTMLLLLLRLRTYTPPEDLLFIGPFHRFVRRYLTWFSIDTLITFVSIGTTGLIYRSISPLDVGRTQALVAGLIFSFIFSVSGLIFGVNRTVWARAGFADVVDLVPPVVVSTVISMIANRYWSLIGFTPGFPDGMIIISAVLATSGFVVARYRWTILEGLAARWSRVSQRSQAGRERVLIVGCGTAGQFIAWMLANLDVPGSFYVAGFVDDDMYKRGRRIRGIKVIGTLDEIPALVEKHDIGILIFAIHRISKLDQQKVFSICSSTSAHLVVIPDILGALNSLVGKHEKRDLGVINQESDTNPIVFSWSGIPPELVDIWLQRLFNLSSDNDMSTVRRQIRTLRHWIKSTDNWPDAAWGMPVNNEGKTQPLKEEVIS